MKARFFEKIQLRVDVNLKDMKLNLGLYSSNNKPLK